MKLATTAKECKRLVESGDRLEVNNSFYAVDIVQVENNDVPVCGKQLLLELEIKNIASAVSQ